MELSKRAWGAVAVLAAWCGSLGWLALRHYGGSESSRLASEAALRLAPGDVWFSIMAGDVQVGYIGLTLDTLSPGYRLTEIGSMTIPVGGRRIQVNRSTRHDLSPSLTLRSSATRVSSEGWQQSDSVWVANGLASYLSDETERGTSLSGRDAGLPLLTAPYRMAMTGALTTGDSRNLAIRDGFPPSSWEADILGVRDSVMIVADSSAIDPGTGRWEEVSFDTVDTRLIYVTAPTGPVALRVDRRGTVVSLRHPLGVEWRRTDFGVAMAQFRQDLTEGARDITTGSSDLVALAFSGLPTDTTSLDTRYRLETRRGGMIPMAGIGGYGGGRQRVNRNGIVVIRQVGPGGEPAGRIVHDPLVQSGDSTVAALADSLHSAIEAEDWGAVAAAVRLAARPDTGAGVPEGAAATLRLGRGSPDGIARLFAAVLDAGGVRARRAVGVLPRGDTLFTHSWVEIWSPRQRNWTAADPVFGRGTLGTAFFRTGFGGSSRPELLFDMVADVKFMPAGTQAGEVEQP